MKAEGMQSGGGRALGSSVEAIASAMAAAVLKQKPGDLPSPEETRELLGLFARLQSEALRQAVLGLMRTIVESGT